MRTSRTHYHLDDDERPPVNTHEATPDNTEWLTVTIGDYFDGIAISGTPGQLMRLADDIGEAVLHMAPEAVA